jgi:hypothetical protein
MLDMLLPRWSRTPIDADAKLRPARDVFMAERDGIAVLLDLRREVYLGLDEVGTMAWREIENGASADSVALRVCEEYDAPADAVRADIHQFVADLKRRRLVVRA